METPSFLFTSDTLHQIAGYIHVEPSQLSANRDHIEKILVSTPHWVIENAIHFAGQTNFLSSQYLIGAIQPFVGKILRTDISHPNDSSDDGKAGNDQIWINPSWNPTLTSEKLQNIEIVDHHEKSFTQVLGEYQTVPLVISIREAEFCQHGHSGCRVVRLTKQG